MATGERQEGPGAGCEGACRGPAYASITSNIGSVHVSKVMACRIGSMAKGTLSNEMVPPSGFSAKKWQICTGGVNGGQVGGMQMAPMR